MRDDYVVRVPRGYGRLRFSKEEIPHILLSVGVLTLAFAIVFSSFVASQAGEGMVVGFIYSLGLSLLIVLTGFFLHEMAHKYVAQRYGAWAEFRSYHFGLIMALVFSFLGFVFAAPGAVYIQGAITRKQNGYISLAGPATNLGVGGVFMGAWLMAPDLGLLTTVLFLLGTVNGLFAVFNMLPIPPLDGSKVLRWNPLIYGITMAAGVVLLLPWFGVL